MIDISQLTGRLMDWFDRCDWCNWSNRLKLIDRSSYLCFERSKTHPEKNVVVPLDRIVRLEKGNQYSWIPGGGMIIEVFIQGLDRVTSLFFFLFIYSIFLMFSSRGRQSLARGPTSGPRNTINVRPAASLGGPRAFIIIFIV